MENGAVKDSVVTGQNSQGVEVRGSLLRVTRYLAVFEVYNPSLVLRASEVLGDFKIRHPGARDLCRTRGSVHVGQHRHDAGLRGQA